MNIVLIEPQIPPNTGNIARLCAAVQATLHLVGPLGFRLSDRYLKRAGLDYWEYLSLKRHSTLEGFLETVSPERLHFFSKKAPKSYLEAGFKTGDYLVFGSETSGLPGRLSEEYPERFLRIPIFQPDVRSLNLSSSVAIATYEALRQAGRLSV